MQCSSLPNVTSARSTEIQHIKNVLAAERTLLETKERILHQYQTFNPVEAECDYSELSFDLILSILEFIQLPLSALIPKIMTYKKIQDLESCQIVSRLFYGFIKDDPCRDIQLLFTNVYDGSGPFDFSLYNRSYEMLNESSYLDILYHLPYQIRSIDFNISRGTDDVLKRFTSLRQLKIRNTECLQSLSPTVEKLKYKTFSDQPVYLQLPNLKTLSMRGTDSFQNLARAMPFLQQLTSVTVHDQYTGLSSYLLQLPNVTYINVHTFDISATTRIRSNLRTLKLHQIGVVPPRITDPIQHNLKTFAIKSKYFTNTELLQFLLRDNMSIE
jgi:hypothetical protein